MQPELFLHDKFQSEAVLNSRSHFTALESSQVYLQYYVR